MSSLKLSDLVNDLSEVWYEFIRLHNKSFDLNLPIKERRIYAERSENLINKRHYLTSKIDKLISERCYNE